MKKYRCERCKFTFEKKDTIKSKYTGWIFCKDLEECTRRRDGLNLSVEEIIDLAERELEKYK